MIKILSSSWRFIVFTTLFILPVSLFAMDVGGIFEQSNTFGSFTFTKPQGVSAMTVKHHIFVFAGHSITDCNSINPVVAPTPTSVTPALTPDQSACWTCTPNNLLNQCDPGFYNNHPYFYDCNVCSDPPTCSVQVWTVNGCYEPNNWYCDIPLKTYFGRNCNLKEPPYSYLVDGAIFKPGAFGYAKNNACGGGDVPNVGLVVSKTTAVGAYLWDDVTPVCIRGGTPGGAAAIGFSDHNFHTDAEIIAKKALVTSAATSTDITLTYTGTLSSTYPVTTGARIYTGAWSKWNIQALGLCSDSDSGCNPAGAHVFSGPLSHLQTTFPASFSDVALNNFAGNCSSTTRKQKLTMTRSCSFMIDPKAMSGAIHTTSGALWFASLPPGDRAFLTGTMNSPPTAIGPFTTAIKQLRNLSMSGDSLGGPSLSTALDIAPPGKHDLLYTLLTGSCNYTSTVSDDLTSAGEIKPLIDKIKPTIEISSRIGSGAATFTNILKQEGTATAGTPNILDNTKNYYAGSGTINFTLIDSGSSSFTAPATWTNYNGISGINSYIVTICQTKTYSGIVLNANCSGSPTRVVGSGSFISGGQYNASGTIVTPHSISSSIFLSDTSGIQVAGTYQVYIAMTDEAGNTNTASVSFKVNPIPPSPIDLCSATGSCVINQCTDPTNCPPPSCVPGVTCPPTACVGPPSVCNPTCIGPHCVGGVGTGTGAGGSTSSGAGGGIIPVTYANAQDKLTYRIDLFDTYGNPLLGWNIHNLQLSQTGIYLDEVAKSGSSAVFLGSGTTYYNIPQDLVTDPNDGGVVFSVMSYTPGSFGQQFTYSYQLWDEYMNPVGPYIPVTYPSSILSNGEFLHILTGAIDLYTTNRIDLGTNNDVRLDFYTTTSTGDTTFTEFTVSNFLESLISRSSTGAIPSPYFSVTNTGAYSTGITFNPAGYPSPTLLAGAFGTFTAEQIGPLFQDTLRVMTWPYITLTFGDNTRGGPQTARYYVSDVVGSYGSGLVYGSGGLNRIYVEGNKRTTGKEGYVDVTSSIGATNSADSRNAIHKNVGILLRNRVPVTHASYAGGIINRVKYLSGSVGTAMISTDMNDWDTLIIKGGDLTIGSDFNSGTALKDIEHKGIIVLADDDGNGGNIFIKPNVQFIGATLFADETIYSVKPVGPQATMADVFVNSDSSRTLILDKQLVFYGGVFSKNTVGGAVLANSAGQYVLPWKNTSTSLDEAVKYDLAFLRMSNNGWIGNLNRLRAEFVVILHDARNISDPLPGFANVLQ